MFGRKKVDNPKKSRRSSGGLAQYGLIDIPDFDNFDKVNDVDDDDDDDDDDLEAELLALTAGAPVPRKQKKVPAAIPAAHLDKMVADSLKDIPSDESVSGDDDDDPALLDELTGLISDEEPGESGGQTEAPQKQEPSPSGGIASLLNERLVMYQQAEANAKAAGESARARRFGRGIKTLTDLIKQAKTGKTVDENEIPPPVAVQIKKPTTIEQPESESQPPSSPPPPPPVPARTVPPPIPQRTAPPPPSPGPTSDTEMLLVEPDVNSQSDSISPEQRDVTPQSPTVPDSVQSSTAEVDDSEKEKMLNLLIMRRDQYKLAAVKAKRSGDVETALRFVKISKQFDTVINAVNEGKPVDLSAMPPPPPSVDTVVPNNINDSSVPTLPVNDRKEEQEKQRSSEPSVPSEILPEEGATSPEEEVYQVTASSVSEALEQRLKVYQVQEQSAREAGNASKARRMGRIVKQYQDAIKLHKAGKPIPVDELPTPPGYAPIPVEGKDSATGGGGSAATSPKPATPAVSPLPSPAATKPITPAVIPSAPSSSTGKSTDNVSNKNVSEAVTDKATQKINARRGAVERQMSFLVSRQKEFKLAALEAKKKGEINQAKEYLRLAKGFEPLLDAASSGLPIDMDSVPVPPSAKLVLESDFDVISSSDCVANSDSDIFEKLESDLTAQLKMCMETRNHFKAIGDVASANRFEQLALHSKKDLNVVRVAHKKNETVPRFHYETKSFSIVQCNTDLTDNDLELTFVQGINYNVPNPKEVDTYIKFEFPYPNDDPVKEKTAVIYNTNNPEYNVTFPLTIHRNSRACQRVFKRHSIKCEIWSKGGFFRGDTLIGTASVKLQPLETKCTIHDSFDLMDGRKTVGGKLEVKIRIRNPILTKQVEQVQEKWLVIDH